MANEQASKRTRKGGMSYNERKYDVRQYAPGVLLIREADYQRLLAVVDAARGYVASPEAGHSYHVPTAQAYAALRDALAAYEGDGGE